MPQTNKIDADDTLAVNVAGLRIFGLGLDAQGRCTHWKSPVDIVANKCAHCGKFYACFRCHDELETHQFRPVAATQPDTVLCGCCGQTFAYHEYQQLAACSNCQHHFNPRCALHAGIYCD